MSDSYTITGYKYNGNTAAKAAKKLLKDLKGLPLSEGDVTTEYVSFTESFKPNGEIDFYYIVWQETLTELLGKEPEEIEVNNGANEL